MERILYFFFPALQFAIARCSAAFREEAFAYIPQKIASLPFLT